MKRVVGGLVMCALLAGAIACTSNDPPAAPPTENVAVEPDEVVRHETAAGAPISFGIEVPEGAVMVGPLVRQRRGEVADMIGGPVDRAEALGEGDVEDETSPHTRDPEEPTPPDFTTAMLRIDGDPSTVVKRALAELSDSLSDSGIEPEHWRKYCVVSDGVYTGCRLHARGTTEEGKHVAVKLTVDPGDPGSKFAPAGSLLQPVMVLTLERIVAPDGEKALRPLAPPEAQAREAQAAINSREAEEDAIASLQKDDGRNGKAGDKGADRPTEQKAEQASDDVTDSEDEGDSDDADQPDQDSDEPAWPTMKREWPAEPGDWILTPKWKIRPNTEVILSSSTPQVAMLAVDNGADTDAIARRYIRAFADEATTPKMDEVEDRNELSITYTPRNDGSGPSVAVTTVATGRGNYIELLFHDGVPSYRDEGRADGPTDDGPEKSDKPTAKRTTSKTG